MTEECRNTVSVIEIFNNIDLFKILRSVRIDVSRFIISILIEPFFSLLQVLGDLFLFWLSCKTPVCIEKLYNYMPELVVLITEMKERSEGQGIGAHKSEDNTQQITNECANKGPQLWVTKTLYFFLHPFEWDPPGRSSQLLILSYCTNTSNGLFAHDLKEVIHSINSELGVGTSSHSVFERKTTGLRLSYVFLFWIKTGALLPLSWGKKAKKEEEKKKDRSS